MRGGRAAGSPTGHSRRLTGRVPPSPAGDAASVDPGEHLLQLNGRANAGDPADLAEPEEYLDRHPDLWRTMARRTADTTAGWAGLLGGGQPLVRAVLARELSEWTAGLAGPDPCPLVAAAAGAAAVAWLASRFAERELFAAPPGKRTSALGRLGSANRQLREALKLVADARAAAEGLAVKAAKGSRVAPAAGPRLAGKVG